MQPHCFLLVLRNHNPVVAFLHTEDFVRKTICSPDADSFTVGELAVKLGETAGFAQLCCRGQNHIVAVDEVELVESGDYVWTPLKLESCERKRTRDEEALQSLLGAFYSELQTLFKPVKDENSLRVPLQTVQLPKDVCTVPDLNKYWQSVLLLQADCATQKTRHIMKTVKEHLRFNRNLKVMFVSSRISHAYDLHADLKKAFDETHTPFEIYNDADCEWHCENVDRVVVQFNSINNSRFQRSYNIVVLDEICSTLGFLTLGNQTIRSTCGQKNAERTRCGIRNIVAKRKQMPYRRRSYWFGRPCQGNARRCFA